MTAELNAAFNFTDLGGLGALRREAAQDSPEARRVVAQQFESMFLSLVLSSMRGAAEIDGGLVDNDRLRLAQDMHDRQLALTLSQGRGIGLAESILRQLGDAPPAASRSGGADPAARALRFAMPARAGEPGGPTTRKDREAGAITAAPRSPHRVPASGVSTRGQPRASVPASPERFVADAWPYARRAAERLGVPAEVLIAQAALETGWGEHMIRDASGASSFNLFGIKAGSSWPGRRISVQTLEFVGGVPERRRDAFRAYDSLAESFEDYVALVRGQTRYRAALEAEDARAYVEALQDGGYSTDPRYADKIMAIVERGLPGGRAQAAAAPADNDVTRLTSAVGRAPAGDGT
ncbi:MAG: flagellar assembly peptidoglycan hydrolase FlgJ [Gammaproteobacteria bacterium]|nr:flagellar assembly peptidoglycan hydrolase FlgJ [Gammaproteobacteria bacterium]